MIHSKKNQKAFSLIELLVVVSIILILAALMIPKLLSARAAAVESAGGSRTKAIANALTIYSTKYDVGYPAAITTLGGNCSATPPDATKACLIDDSTASLIGSAPIQNYDFVYTQTNSGKGFTVTASPASTANSAVQANYWVDEGMTIHRAFGAAATSASPTL